MAARKHFFTSESVGEGHPDKVCDQISDGVLDDVLRQDPYGRVACETYVTMGLLIVGGEITTTAYADIQKLARKIIQEIGYTHPKYGFDYHTCAIVNTINSQSPDIAQGVNKGGAGDQGFMVGFACKETEEFMPLPIMLSHKLVRRMAEIRRQGVLKYLGPDCKSQVSVEYHDGHPKRVDSVVLACQHTEEILDSTKERITKKARQELIDVIARPILKEYLDKDTKYYINETGKFVIGGPQSDTGMTGRKIVVDTYGGVAAPGGGAFSGKDPTKVDRSAAYMARYVAKNIVAAGLA
ncbi:MAG: methionine adenosyltransferase, partial [Candidatus Omnitrophica bacterium]|nr:methionine adenosyltransferase [Candidatus Omnitrophota bacterium]